MHFIGETSTAVTNGGHENPTISNEVVTDKTAGDVVIYGNQEYVWNGNAWQLLGDEGSYALRSHTATVGVVSDTSLDWSAGSTPTLGENIAADDITAWSAGSASNAVVQSGVLRLTNSVAPSLTYESRSIPNVTNVGSTPSLTITPTTSDEYVENCYDLVEDTVVFTSSIDEVVKVSASGDGSTKTISLTTNPADATITASSETSSIASATYTASTNSVTITGASAGSTIVTLNATKTGYASFKRTILVVVE
jgi:hypothetical protein